MTPRRRFTDRRPRLGHAITILILLVGWLAVIAVLFDLLGFWTALATMGVCALLLLLAMRWLP